MDKTQIKNILKIILDYAKKVFFSKVLITACIGAVWLIFLCDNSVMDYLQYQMKVRQLTSEVNYYKRQIADCNAKMESMRSDWASLEKYAREQYYMKRKNEDIFIIKN